MPSIRLTPEQILEFLQEVTQQITFIEDRTLGGFEITTDIGASFPFQIFGDTPEEVVLAYFWHVHGVHARPVVGMERLALFLRIGPRRLIEQRERSKKLVDRLEKFAKANGLPPPPPKDEDDPAVPPP